MEERVIGNDYTFSFAGRRSFRRPWTTDCRVGRSASCCLIAQCYTRRQRLRVELRLHGELKARYQGSYVEIGECGIRTTARSSQ